jgi:hypothetical protein
MWCDDLVEYVEPTLIDRFLEKALDHDLICLGRHRNLAI